MCSLAHTEPFASFLPKELQQMAFSLSFAQNKTLQTDDFVQTEKSVTDDHSIVVHYYHKETDISVAWQFSVEDAVLKTQLHIANPQGQRIESAEICTVYAPQCDISKWRALYNASDNVEHRSGMLCCEDLPARSIPLTSPCGAFPNHAECGLFAATVLPQKQECIYYLSHTDTTLSLQARTLYIHSSQTLPDLCSETLFITTAYTPHEAFSAFAAQYPIQEQLQPQYGYSTWDYYYSALSMEDVLENIEAMELLPHGKSRGTTIQIDDGWQYLWGEWEPNRKFPPLDEVAQTIQSHGYIAGIWTAPLMVSPFSYTALRNHDALIKDIYGDPYVDSFTGFYMIDPTAPAGEAFICELYTRLYQAGFRYFKVDYVHQLLGVPVLHDRQAGVYDAVRRLFALIRSCVKDSVIMGCSLPYGAGPGVADCGRTGIDIHNQWSHVRWAVESYAMQFWLDKRIWCNDIDYLVVRGTDTSLEAETTVADPKKYAPEHPRWRSGPVFTATEAEAWKNIVKMTGGNVFLSDRVSMLNERGLQLADDAFTGPSCSGVPLDLCEREIPSFWLQKTEDRYILTVVNWEETEQTIPFSFSAYGLPCPEACIEAGGTVSFRLTPHESAVYQWHRSL